jgi:hypothetical protein
LKAEKYNTLGYVHVFSHFVIADDLLCLLLGTNRRAGEAKVIIHDAYYLFENGLVGGNTNGLEFREWWMVFLALLAY